MFRKENTLIVFYTKEQKYAVFKHSDGKYALPQDKCTEEDDNYCPPLCLSRHILTQISGGFSSEMLTTQIKVEEDKNQLKTKFDGKNWNKLWMSIEYNGWNDAICDTYQSDLDINGINYSIYYQEINEQAFRQNMENLKVDYQLLSEKELKRNQNISEATHLIIQSGLNMADEIRQQEILKNSPPSKDNTFIFILHKSQDYREKLLKGIPNMPTKAIYYGLFKRSNQKWLTFNAATNNLPSDNDLINAKAIIQPGSSSSAYDEIEWTLNYREWIKNTYTKFSHLKFLSVCFGEQVLAHSLNGRCGMLEERKKDINFYNVQVQEITFADSFFDLPYVCILDIPKQPLNICKAHGDIVEEVDQNIFQVVGSTTKYHVEVFTNVKKDGKQSNQVLAFQGHPEYSVQWIRRKDAQFSSFFDKIDIQKAQQMAKELFKNDKSDNHLILRKICSSFLNY